MKKILFLLTIAAVLCQACRKDKNDTTPPSDDGLDLTLDIDWSALDQTPSGLTLMLYPTDGGDASDAAPIAHRTSNVSNPKISLPGQDYALICFNQSEAELSDYTFDLSSYATASVTADDPSHLAPLAVASMNSLHPTRALNLMGVLKPTNVVKSMSLKIHVAGMSERAEVRGTLTNMAQGVTLFDRKPLPATIDQPLPPDVWNIALPPDAAQPAELIATFPTFGVFVDDEIRVATRSAADFDLHNILHVTVKFCKVTNGNVLFHVNWGWNGSYNGWYLITSLRPQNENYSSYRNDFVFNIKPKGEGIDHIDASETRIDMNAPVYTILGNKIPANSMQIGRAHV